MSSHFTIDPDRAVQLLGKLQLPEPGFYILKLVQAAIASAASKVSLEVDFFKATVHFVPVEPLATANLFHNLVSTGNPALRHLAVGTNSALAAGASLVALEQGGMRQIYTSKGCWEEKTANRKGVLVRVNRTSFPRPAESNLIEQRCRWAQAPVLLNGNQLNRATWGPPLQAGAWQSWWDSDRLVAGRYNAAHHLVESYHIGKENRLLAPGASYASLPPRIPMGALGGGIRCQAALGLALGMEKRSRLDFVQDGVVVERRQVNLGCPGLVAVLDAAGLPTDLSGFKLVEGFGLEAILERLPALCKEMVQRWRSRPQTLTLPDFTEGAPVRI